MGALGFETLTSTELRKPRQTQPIVGPSARFTHTKKVSIERLVGGARENINGQARLSFYKHSRAELGPDYCDHFSSFYSLNLAMFKRKHKKQLFLTEVGNLTTDDFSNHTVRRSPCEWKHRMCLSYRRLSEK